MNETGISKLLRAKNTIFTFKEISLIWQETNPDLVKRRVSYYVKTGKLYRLRRGVYAKDKDYDKLELATKIYTPSYVSLETVLGQAGVVFQYYSQIFTVSYLSREIAIDDQVYSYKKIKDTILTNSLGVGNKENYSIASPERAFLDVLYLYKDYHFDNPASLDWEKVYKILPIYGSNKHMVKKVNQYYELAKNKN